MTTQKETVGSASRRFLLARGIRKKKHVNIDGVAFVQVVKAVLRGAERRKLVRCMWEWREFTLLKRVESEANEHYKRMLILQQRLEDISSKIYENEDQELENGEVESTGGSVVEIDEQASNFSQDEGACESRESAYHAELEEVEEKGKDEDREASKDNVEDVHGDPQIAQTETKLRFEEKVAHIPAQEIYGTKQEAFLELRTKDELLAAFNEGSHLDSVVQEHVDFLSNVFDQFAVTHDMGQEAAVDMKSWLGMNRLLGILNTHVPQRALINIFRHHAKLFHSQLGLGLFQLVEAFLSIALFIFRDRPELLVHYPRHCDRLGYLLSSLENASPDIVAWGSLLKNTDARAQVEKTPKRMDTKEQEEMMEYLFRYYCSFGDKSNQTRMSCFKLKKWCQECSLLNHHVRPEDVEICFASVLRSSAGKNRRTLNFEETKRVFALLGKRAFFPDHPQVLTTSCYTRLRQEILKGWAILSAR